ncbi:MAG: hypothetical protein ABIJ37_08105 [Pseudomonadota bacterium]
MKRLTLLVLVIFALIFAFTPQIFAGERDVKVPDLTGSWEGSGILIIAFLSDPSATKIVPFDIIFTITDQNGPLFEADMIQTFPQPMPTKYIHIVGEVNGYKVIMQSVTFFVGDSIFGNSVGTLDSKGKVMNVLISGAEGPDPSYRYFAGTFTIEKVD